MPAPPHFSVVHFITPMDLLKFKVTGVVQGVSFRYYTQLKARELGLRGWCHNHPDESVEGAAAGSSEAIAKFKVFLHTGPRYAQVDHVEMAETRNVDDKTVDASLGGAKGFEIRRYRR